jgi:hypothetical protein
MTEESREDYWEGTPLQIGGGMDPYGIEEIVIEFDTGDEEVLKPRLREKFGSYELHEAGVYIETIVHDLLEEEE